MKKKLFALSLALAVFLLLGLVVAWLMMHPMVAMIVLGCASVAGFSILIVGAFFAFIYAALYNDTKYFDID